MNPPDSTDASVIIPPAGLVHRHAAKSANPSCPTIAPVGAQGTVKKINGITVLCVAGDLCYALGKCLGVMSGGRTKRRRGKANRRRSKTKRR
jgi:hypothetical protein